MKRTIITLLLTAAVSVSSVKASAAYIPRETAPQSATEEQIVIVENLISDILDEVAAGNLGYTLAAGYANTRIRKAVIDGQTNGHGYGILSPIAQNAIRKRLQDNYGDKYEYKLYDEAVTTTNKELSEKPIQKKSIRQALKPKQTQPKRNHKKEELEI